MKRTISIILILVLCVSVMVVRKPAGTGNKASANTFRSGFSIIPEKEDASGIALDTGFILSSQSEIDLDFVKECFFPQRRAVHNHAVRRRKIPSKPAEPLKQNKVYFIDIKTKDGNTVSFAFQTKRDFTVLGSLPENMSSYVPVDTGIELYFHIPMWRTYRNTLKSAPKLKAALKQTVIQLYLFPKN